ncbi:hypothetical protein GCM10027020_07890 [Nocardioides salsibiostraticola]
MPRDPKRTDQVVRITTAAENKAADIRLRQRRYLMSMSLRTICFVGAVIVREGVFMWILITAAIFLPYIAVVMANAVSTKSDGFALVPGQPNRPQLSGPSGSVREI